MKIRTSRGPIKMIKTVSLLLASLMISACTNMPTSIQSDSTFQLSLQTVQQKSADFKGKTVRWGGVITQVINNADDTWVEVLSLDLNSHARPSGSRKNSQGRFIAKITQFIDPEIYQEGHSITVVGILADKIDGKIGEFNYSFPVVIVQGHHLWSKRTFRHYPYIQPGYWYYGFHPYWHFGYGYPGYGVRRYSGYYPYYPLYGHLQRDLKPERRIPGVFKPVDGVRWPIITNPRGISMRTIAHNNPNTRGQPRVNSTRATKPVRATNSRQSTSRPQTVRRSSGNRTIKEK